MLKYRPEIDGLRTIAVLAVVIYHAQFALGESYALTGGYLGVDIFFVISGFLITSIITQEINAGNFRFIDFYERRARRILPALFTVITCSIPFAWWLMLPDDMREYAGSVLSSLFFSSNFWFWQEDSYTAAPSLLKPFLHTWSLSVEEQFYLFFPVVLILLKGITSRSLISCLVIVLLASLCLAQWSSTRYVDANFYLLPTRIWELMAGALLVFFHSTRTETSSPKLLPRLIMLSAVLMIVVPILTFGHDTLHPSFITVVPVFGTVLIIYFAQPEELITRLLSSKPIVLLGKWSYGFYLWHFPVFAFARISDIELTLGLKIGFIVLSLILAALSYYFVEQLTRRKSLMATKTFTVLIGTWFAAILIAFSLIYSSNGLPHRLGSLRDLVESAKIEPVTTEIGGDCHQRLIKLSCFFARSETKPALVNVGDSHANMLASQLNKVASKLDMSYAQLSQDACPLIRDTYGFRRGQGPTGNCHSKSQADRLARVDEFGQSVIVYSGRFQHYLTAENFDNGLGGVEQDPIGWMSPKPDSKQDPEEIKRRVVATISEFLEKGNTVVMMYPTPEVGWKLPKYVNAKLDKFPEHEKAQEFRKMKIVMSYDLFMQRAKETYALYDSLGEHPNLVRIYPEKVLCDKSKNECYTHDENSLFYADDDHLSPVGAALVVKEIEKELKRRLQ